MSRKLNFKHWSKLFPVCQTLPTLLEAILRHLTSCTTTDYWFECVIIKDRMMGETIMPFSAFLICQLPSQYDTGTEFHTAERQTKMSLWAVSCYCLCNSSYLFSPHSQSACNFRPKIVWFYVVVLLTDTVNFIPVDLISGEKIKYEAKLPIAGERRDRI